MFGIGVWVCCHKNTAHVSSVQFFVKTHLKKSTESAVSMIRCVCVYIFEMKFEPRIDATILTLWRSCYSFWRTHVSRCYCSDSCFKAAIHTFIYIFELAFLFAPTIFTIHISYRFSLSHSLPFSVCVKCGSKNVNI